VVRAPRASIGDVNCTTLTVPVTLDNSASTVAVTYGFWAEDATPGGDGEFIVGDTVQVPAGAIRIVTVPVTEDTRVSVYVFDEGRSEEASGIYLFLTTAELTVDCIDDIAPLDPQARIGGVDCVEMTVEVTLDNSRSEVEAIYEVTWQDHLGEQVDRSVVTPGGVETFLVPVVENVLVHVGVEANGQAEDGYEGVVGLAFESFQVDCTPGDEPRASIGEVNCANLTLPVTLDNTRSTVAASFFILADDLSGLSEPYRDTFTVAAGAERVVRVPIRKGAEVILLVDEDVSDTEFLVVETVEVDCPRTAARPTVAVKGAKLPATGGFNLALPLLGGALLTGGAGMLALSGRRRRY
jgi:LPXTG-motif cell wall-anchored protein